MSGFFTNRNVRSEATDDAEDAVGYIQPDGSLSDFDGLDIFGLWELTFTEQCCSEETRLVSWEISGNRVPEPATMLL